jgi:hypothetical protein
MIKVLVGTSTEKKNVIVEESKTLKKTLDDNDINYSAAQVYLDGATLKPGDLKKTFKDFGITEDCMLIAVVKQSNA